MTYYRSGSTRALLVYIMFGILAIICVASLISGAGEIDLMQKIDNGEYVSEDEAIANDDRVAAIAILYLFGYVGSAVVFLIWIHRAYSNLSALRAQQINYTPGWAVGWFFIPIMNLFRPYQVVSEIWKGSDPGVVSGVPTLHIDVKTPIIVGLWWAIHIISNIIGWIAGTMYEAAEEPIEVINANYAYMISDCFDIVGVIIVIILVRSIDRFQSKRHKIIADLPVLGMASMANGSRSQNTICASCKTEMLGRPKYCPNCGSAVAAQHQNETEKEAPTKVVYSLVECSLCGKSFKAIAGRCPYCGAGL